MNTNCFNQDNDQLDPLVLAILEYNSTTVATSNSSIIPNTTSWDNNTNTMNPICLDLNLTELIPLNPVTVPSPDTFVRIDISFQTGAGDLNFGYLNSTTWVMLNGTDLVDLVGTSTTSNFSVQGVDSTDFNSHQFVYSLPQVKTVEYIPLALVTESSLLLNNLDEGTHPFHFHGHKFWVLAEGDGNFNYSQTLDPNPVFRDTTSVRMSCCA
jgi:Multicopper oxidase